MKKNLLCLFLAAAAWVMLGSGCNTMHGVGKDIKKTGDKIEDSADRHN